nr:hypothetical protein [Tanacetum cinerariifolium]
MASLTFADTHNMIAFLSKSDASAGFDQIVASASIKKANNVVKLRPLIDGKRVIITEDVIRQVLCFDDADGLVRNVDSPSKFLMYPRFLQVLINNLVDDLSSHTTKYTSPTLTQKVFANMRRIGKGFFGIETPLFATMMIQPHVVEEEEDEDDEVPFAPTPPSPIHPPSPSPQEPITTPPKAQPAPPSPPPQEQPADTFESSMTLLNTLMETCATLSQQVAHLEQDKIAQALEILKLKRRVKKLEKKRRSKSSGLKRLRKVGTSQRVDSSTKTVVGAQEDASKQVVGRIEAIDADEEIILVDMETQANLGAELQGRKDDNNAADKEVNAAELTVFNDEEVTMTMAQTLIKMKAKKSRLLDGKMAKRLHDEEIKQAVAREKQEKDDLEKAKVLQKQYVDK